MESNKNEEGYTITCCPKCKSEGNYTYTVDDDPVDPLGFILKSFHCHECGFEEYYNQEEDAKGQCIAFTKI